MVHVMQHEVTNSATNQGNPPNIRLLRLVHQ